MIRVNLLAPEGAGARRVWLPPAWRASALGLGACLLTALAMGGWWAELRRERGALDRRLARAALDLESLKRVGKLAESAAARQADLRARLALIDRVRARQGEPAALLDAISRSVPDGLWLLELKQQAAVVQIDGRATSLPPVTDFTERMQDSGLFKRPIEIVTTEAETFEGTPVVRFTVKAERLTMAVDPR